MHALRILLPFVIISFSTCPLLLQAQIFIPEGLNMPGTWDAYVNPPNKNVFRMDNPPGTSIEVPCGNDVSGGAVNLFNNLYPSGALATTLYRSSFATADAGGSGSYNFLFTSGPCTNFFQNKWSRSNIPFTGTGVLLNAVETYYHCNTIGAGNPAGCVDWGNTDISLALNKYYTVNFQDNGYANTNAIFFETSSPPAAITAVTFSYNNAGGCNGAGGVIVNVVCSNEPSAEEHFYIRYSTNNNFLTSAFAPVVFADTTQLNTGRAVIPYSNGVTYYFYALSSTLSPAAMAGYSTSTTTDIVTLMANTNSGLNYAYTFSGPAAGNSLSGSYLIDNTADTYFPNSFAFSSLAAAVSALNANGVCGHVIFQMKGGFTETAPVAGYVIQYAAGAPPSDDSKTVTFRKRGDTGNHPLLTAWNNSSGTTTAGSALTGDGIFKMIGADYITFEHIDLQENAANGAAGPQMEYGYALLKESVTNGSQYCVISGCKITLNRLNSTTGTGGNEAGSCGIASLNMTNTSSASLAVSGATTDGSNSANKFTGNTITNCFNGIVVKGFNASSPYTIYDQKNIIGEDNNGNTINNYGGSGSATAYGIYTIYQNLDSVSSNVIDNVAGGGTPHTNTTYGIFLSTATNASAYAGNNTITVAKASNSNDLTAFRSGLSGSGKIEVIGNTITNCSSGGSSGAFYGIYIASGVATQSITDNFITSNVDINTTGNAFLVHTVNSGSTTINFTGNTILDFIKTAAGNGIYGYYNITGSTGGTETISSNVISGITGTGATSVYGIYGSTFVVASQNVFIKGNAISALSTGGTASTKLAGIFYQKEGNSKNATISGNEVSGLSGAGEVTGIHGSVQCCSNSTVTTIDSNIVHDLSSSLGDVYGLQPANSVLKVRSNTIYGLQANASKITYGIYLTGFQNLDCYQNKIYDLSAYGTSAAAYGIFDDNSASDHNFYNNIIGNLSAPESSLDNAVSCLQSGTNMSPIVRIYNNTCYLNTASTGSNFGSAAVFIPTNGFANTSFYLKNNVLVNLSAPNGSGVSAALKISETNLSQYMSTSNNNLFYAGSPSPSKVLFYNGTNGYQDTTSFKSFVGPTRESDCVSAMPDFLETVDGSSPDFLHINPSGVNVDFVDEGAVPVINEVGLYGTIITISTDFDNEARDVTAPDIGADEITAELLPIELTDFIVSLQNNDVLLQWYTATEYNSDYFLIERSMDGIHFDPVEQVAAAGFSIQYLAYSFTDEAINEWGVAEIFYRLKMVDLDQSYEYSPVRSVYLTPGEMQPVTVYPNPFAHFLLLNIFSTPAQTLEMEMKDISGRLIYRKNYSIGNGFQTLLINDLAGITGGVYYLDLTSRSIHYHTVIIKQ